MLQFADLLKLLRLDHSAVQIHHHDSEVISGRSKHSRYLLNSLDHELTARLITHEATYRYPPAVISASRGRLTSPRTRLQAIGLRIVNSPGHTRSASIILT